VWEGRSCKAPPYPDQSLIRFCKEIDRDSGNSGKINHRISKNYPATSANSGFFTDDTLPT
jgi:hypothetical protein